ncbi:hypothetical protein Trydic_g18916 [Trypoxylus dichotomus]
MIWGWFDGMVVGDIAKIEGILKKEQYQNTLENDAIPSGLRPLDESIKVMEWPPQIPDLNFIELLCKELNQEVRKEVPILEADFWKKLQEAWVPIP